MHYRNKMLRYDGRSERMYVTLCNCQHHYSFHKRQPMTNTVYIFHHHYIITWTVHRLKLVMTIISSLRDMQLQTAIISSGTVASEAPVVGEFVALAQRSAAASEQPRSSSSCRQISILNPLGTVLYDFHFDASQLEDLKRTRAIQDNKWAQQTPQKQHFQFSVILVITY